MRAWLVIPAVGVVLAGAADSAGNVRAAGPTAVGVGLREFRVALYRNPVPAGVLRLNVTNFGEDPHDVAIRHRGGQIVAKSAQLPPQGRTTLRVAIRKPGSYIAYCTLADHEQRGMRARLKVIRR